MLGIGFIVLVLGGSLYFLWGQYNTEKENRIKYEIAYNSSFDALQEYGKAISDQNQVIVGLNKSFNEARKYVQDKEETILSHDFDALARSQPAMLERRINSGLNSLFRHITGDYKNGDTGDTSTGEAEAR